MGWGWGGGVCVGGGVVVLGGLKWDEGGKYFGLISFLFFSGN